MGELEHTAGMFTVSVPNGWAGRLDEVGGITLRREDDGDVGGALWLQAVPLDDRAAKAAAEALKEVVGDLDEEAAPEDPPWAADDERWRGGEEDEEDEEDEEEGEADRTPPPRDAKGLLAWWTADAGVTAGGPAGLERRGEVEVAWFDGEGEDAATGLPERGRYWALVKEGTGVLVAHTWPRDGAAPPERERVDVEAIVRSLVLKPGALLPLHVFTALVAKALEEARPDLPVELDGLGSLVVGDGDGRVQLDNQWRQCGGNPEAVERLAKAIAESLGGDDAGTPTLADVRARLRPVIKHDAFAAEAPLPLVSRRLVGPLLVCYVIDAPYTLRYVVAEWLAAWTAEAAGFDAAALHRQALANLTLASAEVPMKAAAQPGGRVDLMCFDEGDGYDAARVLLPDLRARVEEHLGAGFLVGVPNRDFLIAVRGDDPDLVAHCRDTVAEQARTMPYPLHGGLLRLEADGSVTLV